MSVDQSGIRYPVVVRFDKVREESGVEGGWDSPGRRSGRQSTARHRDNQAAPVGGAVRRGHAGTVGGCRTASCGGGLGGGADLDHALIMPGPTPQVNYAGVSTNNCERRCWLGSGARVHAHAWGRRRLDD